MHVRYSGRRRAMAYSIAPLWCRGAHLVGRRRMRRAVKRKGLELALAQMIDGGVVRDLEDPGRELELGVVRADAVQDLDERLLGQVLGEGAVAHHAIQQRENGPLVAAHQLAERRSEER